MKERLAETYEALRPMLFSIAYRMLGSVAEAEDVVQDAFLRYQRALAEQPGEIDSPKAYLSAVVTRLAIDTCARRGCGVSSTSGSGCRSRS